MSKTCSGFLLWLTYHINRWNLQCSQFGSNDKEGDDKVEPLPCLDISEKENSTSVPHEFLRTLFKQLSEAESSYKCFIQDFFGGVLIKCFIQVLGGANAKIVTSSKIGCQGLMICCILFLSCLLLLSFIRYLVAE